MINQIKDNLALVKNNIAKAAQASGRSSEDIRLVLVTKTIAAENVKIAIEAGEYLFGENKVQEGLQKANELKDESIKWAMIGHLQTNKVKDALCFANEIQSLDRLSLAIALEKRLQSQGRGLDVLVQVNTSNEVSKYGIQPNETLKFLKELTAFDALRVKGFMTLATFTSDESEVRRCFRLLRQLQEQALNEAPQADALQELSMGMSGDYEWAIQEGATTVRIGQAVFGKRAQPDSYYWPGI